MYSDILRIVLSYCPLYVVAEAYNIHTNKSFNNAVADGHMEYIVKYVTKCSNFDRALSIAAARKSDNNDQVMRFLKICGAKDFNRALYSAAIHDHMLAMSLLLHWGADDFKLAMCGAAIRSNISAMGLMKSYGADNFNTALCYAAAYGQLPALRLLKKWGATNFRAALIFLEDHTCPENHNQFEAKILLQNWLYE